MLSAKGSFYLARQTLGSGTAQAAGRALTCVELTIVWLLILLFFVTVTGFSWLYFFNPSNN